MNTRIRLIALLILCAMLAPACGLVPGLRPAPPTPVPPTPTRPRPTATQVPPASPQPTATPLPPTVTPLPTAAPPTATPMTTPAAKPTAEPRIVLSEVSTQTTAPGLVHVVGRAQVFEAVVSFLLRGPAGETLASGVTQASMGAPEWGDFSIDLFYPPPASPLQAVLEVFEASPKDGSPNSLVQMPISLLPAPDLVNWKTFSNTTYNFQVKYPATWYVNQGPVMPAPPLANKFSTYQVRTGGQPLSDQDAEVWITISDMPSISEMANLEQKGYKKRTVVLGGRQAVRYTAPTPAHGVYDVLYTSSGRREYRIQLSAATHDFDSTFGMMLATFTVSE